MKFVILFALFFVVESFMPLSISTADAESRFRVGIDVARFRGDSTKVYVEVYYSFDVSKLKFIKSDTLFQTEAVINVYFKRSSNDSVVARQMWKIPFSAGDTLVLNTPRSYVDVLGFFLQPDIYRMYVVGGGSNDWSKRDSFSVPIDLQPIVNKQISLSDVELCTSIISVGQDSTGRFIKNTYEVKPNPSRIYGAEQPVVFYYLEEYNLLKNRSPNYYTKLTVANSFGKEVITRERTKNRANESNVEVGTVQINTLRTGAYTFNFKITDSVDNSSSLASKKFFVYNPQLPMDSLTSGTEGSVLASEYSAMNEAELDLQFAQVRYIATRAEIAQYNNVKGIDAKRKVLYDFWNRRENDAMDPSKIQKSEYFKRVDYANDHFRNGFKDGWKTDRGRVFIMYGPPDEVERHASEVDTKPYEIWTYNSIQGGVEFVFGDRTGLSDYLLLHSTHRDEMHDENWMNQLKIQ